MEQPDGQIICDALRDTVSHYLSRPHYQITHTLSLFLFLSLSIAERYERLKIRETENTVTNKSNCQTDCWAKCLKELKTDSDSTWKMEKPASRQVLLPSFHSRAWQPLTTWRQDASEARASWRSHDSLISPRGAKFFRSCHDTSGTRKVRTVW